MGIRVNAAISAIENLVKTNYTRQDGVKMVKTEFDRILKNGARQNVTVYRSAERGAAKTTMHIEQDFESLKRVYDKPQLWETGVYDRITKQSHDLYKTGYQETYKGLIPDGSAITKVLETKQVTRTPIASSREVKIVEETRRKSAILNDNPQGDATMLTYKDQYIARPYGTYGLTAGQCTIGKPSYSSKGLHKTKPVIYAGEDGLKRLTDVAFVKNNNKQTRLLLGNETPEQLRTIGFNPVPYYKIN